MNRPYGDRAIAVALALVSLGLVAAVFAVWSQAAQIRQQQATVDRMLQTSAQERQEQEQLRLLVQRLQQQVRDLGGTPATLPPSAGTRPEPAVTGPAGPSRRATPRAIRTPGSSSPSPRPPQPTVSPTPAPSPTPSRVCLGPVCLPPQGAA